MTLGTMNHDVEREELVQLEPLVHQVGGHSSMFVLDDVTVCKPLIGREYLFYRTLPADMKKYTPEFRGTLEVVLQECGEGLSLAALPNEQMSSLRNSRSKLKHGCIRRVSSSSVELESEIEEDDLPSTPSTPTNSPTTTNPNRNLASITTADTHNPWLQQCHQSHLHKLKQKSDSSNVVECIMLENLTFKYRHPCVLDLKMGTRQYGDDAPESKRKSQTSKAAETTTVTLGVRLAGMQFYNREKKCYVFKNKYFGRQLSEDGFSQSLWQFLHNGRRLRFDIAEVIINKLEELRAIISKLDSVRFFTSSLLILYDGYDPLHKKLRDREYDRERDHDHKLQDQRSKTRVDLREKNWGERLEISWGESRVESKCDEDSLPRDRENWSIQESTTPIKHPSYKREMSTTSGGKAPREQISKNESEPPYKSKNRHRNRIYKPKVDVRLIDFAHATHKGMGDSKMYSGPDDGILLGLDSLIKIFQEICENYDQ